jgi:hypothetical protein
LGRDRGSTAWLPLTHTTWTAAKSWLPGRDAISRLCHTLQRCSAQAARFLAIIGSHAAALCRPQLRQTCSKMAWRRLSIVHAILQRGLGDTFATMSAHELAWCRVIVELPHHKGGLGITPLPAIGHGSVLQHEFFFYGSVLQHDCSPGFLSGFTPSCLRMGCWSESCRSQHLEQLRVRGENARGRNIRPSDVCRRVCVYGVAVYTTQTGL